MIAADRPVARPASAKLLLVDTDGQIASAQRSRWTSFLECGDVIVANDAATLPASLTGVHVRTRRAGQSYSTAVTDAQHARTVARELLGEF